MSTPRKPSWKPGGSAPTPAGGDSPWKPGAPKPTTGPSWLASKWVQVGAVAAVLLGLAVVAIVWIFLPRPDPAPGLVIITAGYEGNLAVPHNVAGRKAAEALEGWAKEHGDQEVRGSYAKVETKKAALESGAEEAIKEIRAIRANSSGNTRKKVIIYVAAHGVALPDPDTRELTAYLVPENYDPANPAGLFKFDDLLSAIEENLPAGTQKLLVLDSCSVRVSWSLGQFQPLFVSALESPRYQQKIQEIQNLTVLTAAGKGQPSWVAEEFQMSAFAHFLIQGLRGAADKNDDHSVDGEELYNYCSEKVKDWARHNRARLQQPAIYPPLKDSSRASQMRLAQVENAYKEPDLPGPLPEAELNVCADSWKRAAELEARSPWAHAPHRWRRYLELLVRAEELARAGAADASRQRRKEADEEADAIGRSLVVKLESMKLSIPTLQAMGTSLDDAQKAWVDRFGAELDAGKLDDCIKLVDGLRDAKGDLWTRAVQRLRATEHLLRYVAADAANRAARSRKLLAALDEKSAPWRPVEAEYLTTVLDATAPPPPKEAAQAQERWKLVGRALQLRLRAEAAALGARGKAPPAPEAVAAWVRPLVERGDKARRDAEDLLYTTRADRWTKAKTLMDQAEKDYEDAEKTALYVREAMASCYEALAALPHLSRWLGEDHGLDRDDLKRATTLWARAHDLHVLLQHPPRENALEAAARLNAKRAEVVDGTTGLPGGLNWLKQRAEKEADKLTKQEVTEDAWHRLDAFLRVPHTNSENRAKMLTALTRISHSLHEASRKATKAGGVEDTADRVRAEAARQMELAVAAAAVRPEQRDQLPALLKSNDLGADLGAELLRIMSRRASKAAELAEGAAGADMSKAGESLEKATASARLLDGWAVPTLKADPVAALRQVRLHGLFCWQAERVYFDHQAIGKDGKFYYKAAALGYLYDAGRRTGLDPDKAEDLKKPRLALVAKLKKRVGEAAPLALTWSDEGKGKGAPGGGKFHFTDEASAERFYDLDGPSDIAGTSVRWMTTRAGLEVDDKEVLPWPLREKYNAVITPTGELYKRSGRRETYYTVDAWFRGQRVSSRMDVVVHNEPDHLAVAPVRPNNASLAVLTDRGLFAKHVASKSMVSILLDCSGSMKLPLPGTKVRKWDAALNALRQVMLRMPRGVVVSLHVFGAKEYGDAEMGGIKREWDAAPWDGDPKTLDARMKALARLTPDSVTPLMRAIKQARDDMVAARKNRKLDFELRRSMIVALTDGGDYNFYRMKTLGGKARDIDSDLKDRGRLDTIEEFLKDTFKKPFHEITVNVIGLAIDEDTMKKHELKAHKHLKPALKAIKGNYVDARNVKELIDLMTRNLLRLEFRLDDDEAKGRSDEDAIRGTISQLDREDKGNRENLRWLERLSPSDYKLYVPLMPHVKQRVHLGRGDSLLLELLPDSRGNAFRRWMFINSLARGSSYRVVATRQDQWTLGVVENKRASSGGRLLSMATIEKDLAAADFTRHLQMVRPSWAWFELGTKEKDKADKEQFAPKAGIRSVALYNYPAPCFGFEVPDWPSTPDGNAKNSYLRAWWIEARDVPRAGTASLGGGTLFDLKKSKVNMVRADDEAFVESVVLEKRCRVPYKQDDDVDVFVRGKNDTEQCLVVRLSYPEKKGPYFCDIGDGWGEGVAHRFYHEAGKTTCIFYPITRKQAEAVRQLTVYSVARLKAEAQAKKYFREASLGQPNNSNTRPREFP